MRSVFSASLCLLCLFTSLKAAPEAHELQPVKHVENRPQVARAILELAAIHASATFDAWTTRRALQGNPLAREANPMMRPFAGGPGIYVVLNAAALPVDILTLRNALYPRYRFRPKFVRVLQVLTVGVHTAAGINNLSKAGR